MHKTIGGVILGVMMIVPALTSATTLAPQQSIQDVIASLLQQIQALQQQLKNIQTDTVDPVTPISTGCVSLRYNLKLGDTDASTDGDVTRLQDFLAQEVSFDLGGNSSGYFGPATLRAVQKWQSNAGIISYGSPETTGWGSIGRKTRGLMGQGCGDIVPRPRNKDFSASPTSGSSPLTVMFQTPGLAGGDYALDFGDGTSEPITQCSDICTANVQPAPEHTYKADGTYTATLKKIISRQVYGGADCTGDCATIAGIASQPDVMAIGTVTINVGGSTRGIPVISGLDAPTSLAVGQTGTWIVKATAPSGIQLSYNVFWGDDLSPMMSSQAASVPPPVNTSSTFTHSYASAGTYTPTFTVSSVGGSAQTSATVRVDNPRVTIEDASGYYADGTFYTCSRPIKVKVTHYDGPINPGSAKNSVPLDPAEAQAVCKITGTGWVIENEGKITVLQRKEVQELIRPYNYKDVHIKALKFEYIQNKGLVERLLPAYKGTEIGCIIVLETPKETRVYIEDEALMTLAQVDYSVFKGYLDKAAPADRQVFLDNLH